VRDPSTGDLVKAVEVLGNRYLWGDTERPGVLRHTNVDRDPTACGLVNAVTHQSQEVTDHDRATDRDSPVNELLDLPAEGGHDGDRRTPGGRADAA
jgi:hypothetical protein